MTKFHHGVVWFRRDLRFDDHTALLWANSSCRKISLLFIFDEHILQRLPSGDRRRAFLDRRIMDMKNRLGQSGGALHIATGKPEEIFPDLFRNNRIDALFFNEDYEPYARKRDKDIKTLCEQLHIHCESLKDQVIFHPEEIVKDDQSPYKVFTAYKNKWIAKLEMTKTETESFDDAMTKKFTVLKTGRQFILQEQFVKPVESVAWPAVAENDALKEWKRFYDHHIFEYDQCRNIPSTEGTSRLSPYLRFGMVSIRRIVADLLRQPPSVRMPFLNELIWREFFMMILYHYPYAESACFKSEYDAIPWGNRDEWFMRWCEGRTGYPIVDAGLRQLNETGWMHDRVRMITASFVVKHLHVDWRRGERYFAEKLMDYELSSNNGNWQWAAGTGVDAAPYFRIFHPVEQAKKFDPDAAYIRRWVPELKEVPVKLIHQRKMYTRFYAEGKSFHSGYPAPVADLDEERRVCLALYKTGKNLRR